MGLGSRFRICYRYKQQYRMVDVIAHRLSTADAYAEICFYEAIPVVPGMPSLTFEEVALEAGVSDMRLSIIPPHGFA